MRVLVYSALALCVAALSTPIVSAAPPNKKSPKPVQIVNDPLRVQSAPPPRLQLVGFTLATFAGDAGVLEMSRACAAEFSGSRMCDSRDVLETSNPPDLTGRPRAWVRPSLVVSTSNSVVDASGFQGQANDFSCVGWSFARPENSGLTVSADGSFFAEASPERGRCDVMRPAACCSPLP